MTAGLTGALHHAVVHLAAAYVAWVLFGTLAFVCHLGEQAPCVAAFLPAFGTPGGRTGSSASGILSLVQLNTPVALAFILPHSLLRPHRLAALLGRSGLAAHGRLVYNVLAAASLHALEASFVPLRTPVVVAFPLPPLLHLVLSAGGIVFAATCFLADPRTTSLLGVSQSLGLGAPKPPAGMDALTWVADCVIRRGGPVALVLFTGVCILPPELTLGDAVTRGVAALYLRKSTAFRGLIHDVGTSHHLIWAVRGSLLALALLKGNSAGVGKFLMQWRVLAALLLVPALRAAEQWWGQAEGKKEPYEDNLDKMGQHSCSNSCTSVRGANTG